MQVQVQAPPAAILASSLSSAPHQQLPTSPSQQQPPRTSGNGGALGAAPSLLGTPADATLHSSGNRTAPPSPSSPALWPFDHHSQTTSNGNVIPIVQSMNFAEDQMSSGLHAGGTSFSTHHRGSGATTIGGSMTLGGVMTGGLSVSEQMQQRRASTESRGSTNSGRSSAQQQGGGGLDDGGVPGANSSHATRAYNNQGSSISISLPQHPQHQRGSSVTMLPQLLEDTNVVGAGPTSTSFQMPQMPSIASAANLLVRQASAGRMMANMASSVMMGASMSAAAGSPGSTAAARLRTNKLRAKVSTGNLLKLRNGGGGDSVTGIASTPSPYADAPLTKVGSSTAMMMGQSTMLHASMAMASSTPKDGTLDLPPAWSNAANSNTTAVVLTSPTLPQQQQLGRVSSNLSAHSAQMMLPTRVSSSGHLRGGSNGAAAAGGVSNGSMFGNHLLGPLVDDENTTNDNASISVSFQASLPTHGASGGGGTRSTAVHSAGGHRKIQTLGHEERARMQAVFDKYDTKKVGSIENSSLVKLLAEIGHPMPASQALELLRQVDANQNGLMEFDELLSLVLIFKGAAQFRMDTTASSSVHHWSGSGYGGGTGGGMSDSGDVLDDFADIPGGAKATSTQYHISKAMNKFRAILPDSALWKWAWEVAILVTYVYIFISVSTLHMRDGTEATWNQASYFYYSDIAITAMLLGEMILSCFVSFQNKEGVWVEDFSVITANYLRTWFVLDLISLLPLRCFIAERDYSSTTTMLVLAHFRLARLPRLLFTTFASSNQVGMTREYIGFYFVFAPLARQLAALLCAIHLYAVIWLRVLDDDENYVVGVYVTMYYFSAVGLGGYEKTTLASQWWANVCTLSALFINAAVVGNVVSIMNQADVEGSRQNRLVETQAVLQFFDVPAALQEEILQFQNYVLQKDIQTAHRGLMDSLPAEIRANLQLQLQLHVLYGVPLFRDAHQTVKIALVQQFASVVCCPEEYLVVSGEDATDIIFISYGFIDLVDCNGVYVTTLRNGHSFGEALMFAPREAPVIHEMSAKSLGYSELLVLGIEGLWAVSDMFPAFSRDIIEYGRLMELGVDAHVVDPECVPVTASAVFEPAEGGKDASRRRGSKLELRDDHPDEDDDDDEGVGYFVAPHDGVGSGDEAADFATVHGVPATTNMTSASHPPRNADGSAFRKNSSGMHSQGRQRRRSSVAFASSSIQQQHSGGSSPQERRRGSSSSKASPEEDLDGLVAKRTTSFAESIKNFFFDGAAKSTFDDSASPKSRERSGILRPFRVNADGEVAFLLGIAGGAASTSTASTAALAHRAILNGSGHHQNDTSGGGEGATIATTTTTSTAPPRTVSPALGFPVEGSVGLSTSSDNGGTIGTAATTTTATQRHGGAGGLRVVTSGMHASLLPSSDHIGAPPTPRGGGGGAIALGGGGSASASQLRRASALTSDDNGPHPFSHTGTPTFTPAAHQPSTTGFFFGTGGGPAVAGTSNAPQGKLQNRRSTVADVSSVGPALPTPRSGGIGSVVSPNNASSSSSAAAAAAAAHGSSGVIPGAGKVGALSAHRRSLAGAGGGGAFPTIVTDHGDDEEVYGSPIGGPPGCVPTIRISRQITEQEAPRVVVTATSNSSDEVFREVEAQRRRATKMQRGQQLHEDGGSSTGTDDVDDVVKSPLPFNNSGRAGAADDDDSSHDWSELGGGGVPTPRSKTRAAPQHGDGDDAETMSMGAKKPIIAWHAANGEGDMTSPRAGAGPQHIPQQQQQQQRRPVAAATHHHHHHHHPPHGVAASRAAAALTTVSPNSQDGRVNMMTNNNAAAAAAAYAALPGGAMHQIFMGGGGGGGVGNSPNAAPPFLIEDPTHVHLTHEEWLSLVTEVSALLKLVDQASEKLMTAGMASLPSSPPSSSQATGGGGLAQDDSRSIYSPAATNTPHRSPRSGFAAVSPFHNAKVQVVEAAPEHSNVQNAQIGQPPCSDEVVVVVVGAASLDSSAQQSKQPAPVTKVPSVDDLVRDMSCADDDDDDEQ